jgi:transcriptional regulator with XRE-family HTH domain
MEERQNARFHAGVKKEFGDLLKAARERKGYRSAVAFAEVLGVEPPRYRYWERGQAMPDIPTFAHICLLLDVEPNDLLPRAIRSKPTTPKRPKHLTVVS